MISALAPIEAGQRSDGSRRLRGEAEIVKPRFALPMGAELVREIVRRAVLRRRVPQADPYPARANETAARPTAFPNACLVDGGRG